VATAPGRRRWRRRGRADAAEGSGRDLLAAVAIGYIVVLVLVAIGGRWLAPLSPSAQTLTRRLEGPGRHYLLGTDGFGRDILSRLILATRVTLLAVAEGLGLMLVLGMPAGLLAGFYGGWIDRLTSRISDTLLCLPPIILALAIVGLLGPGLTNAMIAIGVVYSPRIYRVMRVSAASVSEETYVLAGRALGFSDRRIVLGSVLPNAAGAVVVQAAFAAGVVLTAEASLSFLGLGVQPPEASWGTMVRDGFDSVRRSYWSMVPPVVVIVLTTAAFSVIGEAAIRRLDRSDQRGR
jgi:peptide/nickel transport system permease protein